MDETRDKPPTTLRRVPLPERRQRRRDAVHVALWQVIIYLLLASIFWLRTTNIH